MKGVRKTDKSIVLPEKIKSVLIRLCENGHTAYAVGGCVRDMYMGTVPNDYDIATSATPDETEKCFYDMRVIKTGIKHGTVTVIFDDEPIEITTYRIDGNYTDNRHPSSVEFSINVEDDLARRDFTVNAMCCDAEGNFIDIFGGIDDIDNKIIRCVGDANRRFNEDALRILRALRFASTLGFNIEKNTEQAIRQNRYLLKNISSERIYSEFSKLLCGKDAVRILLEYSDCIGVFIPELYEEVGFAQRNPHHKYDVYEHSIRALDVCNDDVIVRYAVLLHDIAKPLCFFIDEKGIGHFHGHAAKGESIAYNIMRRLKADNITCNTVSMLVKYHDYPIISDMSHAKRMLNKFGYENTLRLLEVKKADTSTHVIFDDDRGRGLEKMRELCEEAYREQQCFSLKFLAVNGKDIIALGCKEGNMIGKVLDTLLCEVIDEKLCNEKDVLLERAKVIIKACQENIVD